MVVQFEPKDFILSKKAIFSSQRRSNTSDHTYLSRNVQTTFPKGTRERREVVQAPLSSRKFNVNLNFKFAFREILQLKL